MNAHKISIKKDATYLVDKDYYFPGDEYVIDLDRKIEDDQPDSLICNIAPWATAGIPLTLEIAICKSGEIVFRFWDWSGNANEYLHTAETPETYTATEAQKETVAGLFSGRIRFDGLRLTPGGTLQRVCPIDLDAEEKRINGKIFLA